MKKSICILLLFYTVATTSLFAQGFAFSQRPTVEERVKRITSKLDSAFKLDESRLSMIDTTFKVLFRAQDAKVQEYMSAGTRPDRETMMAEMKKFNDAQDEILGALLTKEEFAIWKEKIQPTMRTRGMGGPGGGGGQFRERSNQ